MSEWKPHYIDTEPNVLKAAGFKNPSQASSAMCLYDCLVKGSPFFMVPNVGKDYTLENFIEYLTDKKTIGLTREAAEMTIKYFEERLVKNKKPEDALAAVEKKFAEITPLQLF